MSRQERLDCLYLGLAMLTGGALVWALLIWGWMNCHDGTTMMDSCPVAATIMPMIGTPYIVATACIGLGFQGLWGAVTGRG